MATCITSAFGNDYCPQVRFTVSEKSNTGSTVTYSWKLEYVAHGYAISTSSKKSYTAKIGDEIVAEGSYAINGVKGIATIKSGTKTISKKTVSQEIEISLSFVFNITWNGTYGGTKTASGKIVVPTKTSYSVSYNANGGSGAPSAQKKWHGTLLTLSTVKPKRDGYDFVYWKDSGGTVYKSGGTYSGNEALTLYAVWVAKTYKVVYKTSAGSGLPSDQTKTHGKNLTLSTVKPKRDGYDFVHWKDSTDTVYKSGGTYSGNEALTLYAVWTVKTYKLSFNANGGTLGSITTLTKKHGANLTITATATRKNYKLLGWAVSKSAKVATYGVNGVYTNNVATTLYAVWQLDYTVPKIENLSAKRCDKNGNFKEDGTYIQVKFSWKTDKDVTSVKVKWNAIGGEQNYARTVTSTGTAGNVSEIIGGGDISIENAYVITASISDSLGNSEKTKTVAAFLFVIDALKGGKGVAFGKPAELSGYMDVGFEAKLRKRLFVNGSVYVGEKTAYDDGKAGVVINPVGSLYLQHNNTPGIYFYIGDATENTANIYLAQSGDNIYMYFNKCYRYAFSGNVAIGRTTTTSDLFLYMPYADGALHGTVSKSKDGLTTGFGWAGSSEYATVTTIRGRTCKVTNASGTTTLSDERLKRDFKRLDRWENFFDKLEPCAFRLNNGTSGRYHVGFRAQQMEKALVESGLATEDFAGIVKMRYTPDPEDPDGNVAYETAGIKPGGDVYGVIYTELIGLAINEIQKIKKRVKELEEQR